MGATAWIALAELVVIAGLALALVRVVKVATEAEVERNRAAAEERAELLERIQRPDRIPLRARPARDGDAPKRPGDLKQLAQIGAVVPTRDAEAGTED